MDLSGLLGGGGGSSSTGGSSSSGGSSLLGGLPLLGFGSSTSGSTPRDDRLPPHVFTTVTSVLYGLAVAAFLLRLYIRLALQRRLYVDDAFNIFSLILLTISVAAYYVYRNEAFAEEDLIDGDYAALLQSDIISKGLLVRKWITAAAIMLWTVVNFTKLSFLFFFRRLISRLRWFTVYWWIVLAYVTVVWGWGISIFLAPCPKLTSLENALQCITGPKAELAVRYSFAQVALDIFGDLLILAIPVKLIWQVRIRWTQKIGLMTSLCLSIAMVGTSAARATGILRNGYLDSLWVIFWYFNSANIALTLSCAAAFRTLYLAHRRSRSPRGGADDEDSSGESGSRGGKACKLSGIKVGIQQILARGRFTPLNTDNRNGNDNRGKWPKGGDLSCSTSEDGSRGNSAANPAAMRELPRPPRAMMTGLRTFIGRNGRDSFLGLESTTMNSEEDLTLSGDSQPLPPPPPPAARDGRERTSTVDVQTRERWSRNWV